MSRFRERPRYGRDHGNSLYIRSTDAQWPGNAESEIDTHWVSAAEAIPVEVRLYDKLFTAENPNEAPEGQDFTMYLNPKSLEVVQGIAEPSLASARPGDRYQFERLGYFCVDKSSTAERLVFNRTAELRDTWAKLQKRL